MSKITLRLESANPTQPLRHGTQFGRTYYGGIIGQDYRIIVANNTYSRVACVVTVDGRNVLDNKPGDPDGQAMIIGANQTYAFEGWRTGLDAVAAFNLVDVAQSYAAKTGDASNAGVIGVAMFEEKREHYITRSTVRGPSAVGAVARCAAPAPARAGTGFGDRIESHVTTTTFERATAEPAEELVVYYDTISNLIEQGILAPLGGPDPFPARKRPAAPEFCKPPTQ